MARQMITTPAGTAFWAKVLEPEEDRFDEGKPRQWSIEWAAPEYAAETLELMQKIEQEFARIHGEGAKPSKNAWPFKEQLDRENKPTGLIAFRFKRNETTRKGNILAPPAVYDARKNPWPQGVYIGNGSKVKVAFSAWGWEDKFNKKGISLSLDAVQVLDLVPFEKRDPADAFDVVSDGYVADSTADVFTEDDSQLSPSQRLARLAAQVKAEAPGVLVSADEEERPF